MEPTSPEDTRGEDIGVLSVNSLTDLAAMLLTPMFLTAAGGDTSFARAAALSMVKSYGATSLADLLCVVQIVAFALASLRTLLLSMDDAVPLALVLRANTSADRLSKAELRHRKIREAQQREEPATEVPEDIVHPAAAPAPAPPAAPRKYPNIPLDVEATLLRIESEFSASANDPQPRPQPRTQAEWRKIWGESAARVANEYLANLDGLSPEERETNLVRADALQRASRDLLSGAPLPPLPDWSFLKPR